MSTLATTPTMPVDAIDATGRHRWDLGKIDELARSIEENGLISPIAVTPDGVLIAGARRLAAVKELGRDRIEVHVMTTRSEASALVKAEMAENEDRKDWLPSEKVAIAKAIKSLEAEEARARQGTRTDLGAETAPSPGKARDKVADAVGMGRTALSEAEAVVDASQDMTLPESVRAVAQDAVEQMDRTGKIAPAAKRVEKARAEAAKPSPSPLRAPTPPAEVAQLSKRDQERGRAHYARMMKLAQMVEAAARGTEYVDLTRVRAVTDPSELEEWAADILKALPTLRAFATKLKGR